MNGTKWALFLVILLTIPLNAGTITLTAVFANKGGFAGRIDEEGTYQLLAGESLAGVTPPPGQPPGYWQTGIAGAATRSGTATTTYHPAMVMNAPTNWDATFLVAPGVYAGPTHLILRESLEDA